MSAFFVFGSWRITSVGQVWTQVPQPIQPLISLMVMVFYFSSSLISGVVPLSAFRISSGWGVIRSKNEPIALLLAGARHRISVRAYKLCLIPSAFAFAGGIGFRGRTLMPSAGFLRGCIISECIDGNENSQQSDNDGCSF